MTSRRKHSSLWMHFTEEKESKKAKCKYCSSYISFAGGSNGNLIRHIKTKHHAISLVPERQDFINLSDSDPHQTSQTASKNGNSQSLAISS
ncbi:unnamed protein product [Euphydryas editha]|uniref:BED-type domain-containing protein n=1 Tax=Euphydryas editha TaxID=104508 RepID=A0AAU9UCQ1_EUPED|nr:unnamed protein product [Euphydryas editha]